MAFRYVVLGAGRLGAAAAYDLAAFGDAGEVVLADRDGARAKDAAARVSRLLKKSKVKVRALALDAERKTALAPALRGAQGVLSTLPSELNAAAAQAAVQAKAHYCDTGSRPAAVRAIAKLEAAAKKAKVSLIPAYGLAPGLSSSLALSAMSTLDFAREVQVYAGALPERASDALEPAPGSALDALALYLEPAQVLRRGRLETVDPLTGREPLEVAGVGALEAAVTGGDPSLCPTAFQTRLVGYELKTLRHPGHFARMAAIRDMGFLSEKPVAVDQQRVSPRELFLALAEKARGSRPERDLVVLRVVARGKKQGRPTEIVYELVDRFDAATGFSAAERTTAFPAAAVLALQARGKVKTGAESPELAVHHRDVLGELRRRGLKIAEAIRASAPAA